MAERAQAELEEFKRRQAELKAAEEQEGNGGGDGFEGGEEIRDPGDTRGGGGATGGHFMNASPDISSPEEELHIRREGNSAHDLQSKYNENENQDHRYLQVNAAGAPTVAGGSNRRHGHPGEDYRNDLDDLEGGDGEELEQQGAAVGPLLPPGRQMHNNSSEYGYENERIEVVNAYPEPEGKK